MRSLCSQSYDTRNVYEMRLYTFVPSESPKVLEGWTKAILAREKYSPLAAYFPSLIQSATRSAIMIVVELVLARTTSGMTEASTTRRPWRPCTRQYWSTTAMVSDAGPILGDVPDMAVSDYKFL